MVDVNFNQQTVIDKTKYVHVAGEVKVFMLLVSVYITIECIALVVCLFS